MKKAQPNFAAEPGVLGPDVAILPDRGPGHKPGYEPEALRQFVSFADGQIITDSLKVAQVHGKRHDNVVTLIRKRIAESGEWGLLHFKEGVYFDPRNQQHHPMFTMNQAGYQFLVGKMTGANAVKHQIAFIEAFSVLARRLGAFLDGRDQAREQLQIRDAVSRSRGTEGSHLMHQRRREKRHLEAALARLDEPVQLDLILGEALA